MIRGLYLVELTVANWSRAVCWYRDVLALPVLLTDQDNQFALFQTGPSRLSLKAGQPQPGTVLLTFEVQDLPAEVQRLSEWGVLLESALKSSPEGYRRAIL